MTAFVLVPGAGGQGWYWHRVVERLEARGHEAVAVDLPATDEDALLEDYVRTVVDATPRGAARAAGGKGLVVVGQSLGGLVAPLVADRCAADLVVLVAAMIPRPAETGGEWWESTGQGEAARRLALDEGRDPELDDEVEVYFHDVPEEVRAEAMRRPPEGQSDGPFRDPWPLDRWPEVPTRVVACARDRLFPLPFMTEPARSRLGVAPDVLDTGHLPALADPDALVGLLDGYRAELGLE
jgi:pimeloyl-ACP methyl ester carboxylesterase